MHFLILAYDGDDKDALSRRLQAREAHLARADKMKVEGRLLYGAAILDDMEQMTGSVMVMDFESRAQLDLWLQDEPYMLSKVWQKIEIKSARVAPMFTPVTH